MFKLFYYEILVCALFLLRLSAASKKAGPSQALWMYYTYAAEVALRGPAKTSFFPKIQSSATKQLTLYDFIRLGQYAPAAVSSPQERRKLSPREIFQNGYKNNMQKAKPILDTTTPNVKDAAEYLRSCKYFPNRFQIPLLFGSEAKAGLPFADIVVMTASIMKDVTKDIPSSDPALAEKIGLIQDSVEESLSDVYEWRRVDTETKAEPTTPTKQIQDYPPFKDQPGLVIKTEPSPVEPDLDVLDFQGTIEASENLPPELMKQLINFFPTEAKDGATEASRTTAEHLALIKVVSDQLARIRNKDPNC